MMKNLEWVTAKENSKYTFKIGLKNHYGTNNPRAKRVMNMTTKEIYNTGQEASLKLGLTKTSIASSIYQKCKCSGAYWKYI